MLTFGTGPAVNPTNKASNLFFGEHVSVRDLFHDRMELISGPSHRMHLMKTAKPICLQYEMLRLLQNVA
jgi:hypothetical protein